MCFVGEERWGIRYLRDPAERARYRVDIVDGLLLRNGELLTTMSCPYSPGWEIFVMDPEGVLYTGPNPHMTPGFQHSSFCVPLAAGGEMCVKNGIILRDFPSLQDQRRWPFMVQFDVEEKVREALENRLPLLDHTGRPYRHRAGLNDRSGHYFGALGDSRGPARGSRRYNAQLIHMLREKGVDLTHVTYGEGPKLYGVDELFPLPPSVDAWLGR
jgi:hypothetical protein